MTLSPYWKEALRIDFEPRVLMKDRLVAKKIELQKAKVKGINKANSCAANGRNKSKNSAAIDNGGGDIEMTKNKSDAEIDLDALEAEQFLKSLQNSDEIPLEQLKIDFVLQLCTAQMAAGQCTVDAEDCATHAAIALGLHETILDLGPRVMHACFSKLTGVPSLSGDTKNDNDQFNDNDNNYLMSTSRDIVLFKLTDVTALALLVGKQGENFDRKDLEACKSILDEIVYSPGPYGWLIQDFFYVALSTLATIAAFFGSYNDMIIVCIIAICIVGIQKLRNRFPDVLVPIEVLVVCAVDAMITALAYRIADYYEFEEGFGPDKACNIPIIFLSPLLVYLPGSELIYGAYEVQKGHMLVGASRLVSVLVKCMVMACGLTIGWTITGYNLMKGYQIGEDMFIEGGIQASFVPTSACRPFAYPWNVQPWWVIFAGWNLVLLIPVLIGLQVRLRELPQYYIIAYVSLLVFGAMAFAAGGLGLSSYLQNIIGLFIATNLACFKEFLTGVPAVSSIIPVLLVLAPGSTVVLDVLTLMQVDAAVGGAASRSADVVSNLWFMGVTYSLGMYIALALWKPFLLKRGVSDKILKEVEQDNKMRGNRNSVVM